MNARYFVSGVGLVAALALTACGGGGSQGGGSNGGGAASAAALGMSADPSGAFAFQPTTLNGAASQPITVNFQNPAGVQHSFVLVKPGTEEQVDQAALAKNGDWTGDANVIAGTKVLTQNGTETVTIPGQPAGTYTYICTVPGHYQGGMKGTLTIR